MHADAGQKVVGSVHPSGVHLFESRFHAQVLRSPSRLLGDPQQHPLVTLVATRHFQCHHEIAAKQHQAGRGAFAQNGRTQAQAEQPETRAEIRVIAQSGQHVG